VCSSDLFDAIRRGDDADIKKWASRYLTLNPNGDALSQEINSHIDAYGFTPTQRDIMKANSVQEILNVKRLMQTRGQLQ
jgi:uncharacterized protein Yka (UPF0111/DUF47 family)